MLLFAFVVLVPSAPGMYYAFTDRDGLDLDFSFTGLDWGHMVDKNDPLCAGAFWELKDNDDGDNRATAGLAHAWADSPTVQLTEQFSA